MFGSCDIIGRPTLDKWPCLKAHKTHTSISGRLLVIYALISVTETQDVLNYTAPPSPPPTLPPPSAPPSLSPLKINEPILHKKTVTPATEMTLHETTLIFYFFTGNSLCSRRRGY